MPDPTSFGDIALSFAKHTSDPPPFDAAAANKAFLDNLKKADGTAYKVFEAGGFQALNQWLLGIGAYDGTGLRDVVEANAQGMDALKKTADVNTAAIGNLEDRVAALEAQPAPKPFP